MSPDPALLDLLTTIDEALATIALDDGGGLTSLKAHAFARLVLAERPSLLVDVGVLHGRSTIALALAARYVPGARVVGVDPFDAAAYADPAQDHVHGEAVADWIATFDFDRAYADVELRIRALRLAGRCRILREPSLRAAERFEAGTVDLLHLDADHGAASVQADLAAWLPRLRPGAVLMLDDISWPGVAAGVEAHGGTLRVLAHVSDVDGLCSERSSDFAVYRVGV